MSVTDDTERKFVMKHVFKNVKNSVIDKEGGAEISGPVEEHFGVEWKLRISKSSTMDFRLDCLYAEQSCDWSIETEFEVTANGKKFMGTKKHKFSKNSRSNDTMTYIQFNELGNYSSDANLAVEFQVTIKKTTGIEKKKLKNFDNEKAKEHSDVMLKIGDQKFHVYKMYLSYHSSYFKSLFSGNFSESQKSEIELKDIDPNDFQDFLELIHGDSVVRDGTVAGILKLADFFDSETALLRCEEFLLNRSKQPLKFKFHAAIKYKLDKLKKKCFSEMNKNTNFMDLAPEDHADFGTEVWDELYKKLASFV